MMTPALPGFYYDAEKKKYFKIQPNHFAAHGAASKHSKAALKKGAEEQREHKRRKLYEQLEQTTRLQRSKVLESPLGGGWGLMRELGTTRLESSNMMMRAWTQGLRRWKVADFDRPDAAGSGTFVFDKATQVLTFANAFLADGAGAVMSV